ncbi:hypothetical protein MNEG_3635 [Monoraphidium neglectum]|uniref:Peptide transporter PTR2 n=1 Tax=Monoraphidium neglectum TaxID=145388 RepID=A0A0D2K127_9CHLO|nr:hypothetical protein MNEG_3635 [Monoraphidium neglectum]KIZ04318.1 hypothetical protein MNEG_3635 [Monoraphidium neglectum]|eukprot:XP_013903337.1 hypothetical protein MNEG_3635 [Monoraphidium neglectum]
MTLPPKELIDIERDRRGGKTPSDEGGAAPTQERRNRVLAACACILGNETAERLAYYGLATNLSLYAKQYLGYPASQATSLLQAWKASVYLTPLLGAFYFSVNVGSLVATLVVVPVQEAKGYAIGFGIPTALMGCAIIIFLLGAFAKLYTYVPPEGSPLYRIYQVLAEPAAGEGSVKFTMAYTDRMRGLDKAALPHGRAGVHQVSRTEVEETKALLGIMPVFLVVCIWQMAYDPIFTLLPLSGDVMDRSMGHSFKIPASSISFANTFGVMISVAVYDIFVVPIAAKMGRPISTMSRIGAGFIVAMIAVLSAGFIELARYRAIRHSGLVAKWEAASAANPKVDYTDAEFVQPMSIWWQAVPYFVMGAAETLTNVGVMELFFNEVSEGTRALGSSINLLTTAIGTYLAGALNIAIAGATTADPWVADNPMYGHYDLYYFVNAGILVVGYAAFLLVARNYKEKPVVPHHLLHGGKASAAIATATGGRHDDDAGPASPAGWRSAAGLRSRWPRMPGSPGGSSGSPRDGASRSPLEGLSPRAQDAL